MQGFSPHNLKYMRALAEAWPDEAIVQEPLAQLTWYHNLTILEKVKRAVERLWYAHQSIEHGWSRNVLVLQIESDLYRRQGKAITNFQTTLPSPQSDLAQQLLKDPYNFDFLTLTDEAQERDLERDSSPTCASFSSSWASASPSSAARSRLKSEERILSSISSSTT